MENYWREIRGVCRWKEFKIDRLESICLRESICSSRAALDDAFFDQGASFDTTRSVAFASASFIDSKKQGYARVGGSPTFPILLQITLNEKLIGDLR